MSLSENTVAGHGYGTFNPPGPVAFISLNELFKESLRKGQLQHNRLKVIVRCESLPLVLGNREELSGLFDCLVSMIFSNFDTSSRLFLHIDCTIESEKNLGIMPGEDFKKYQIRFHTNTTTSDEWQCEHQETLESCRKVLAHYQGNLVVNRVAGTGCLFCISVPGKSQ